MFVERIPFQRRPRRLKSGIAVLLPLICRGSINVVLQGDGLPAAADHTRELQRSKPEQSEHEQQVAPQRKQTNAHHSGHPHGASGARCPPSLRARRPTGTLHAYLK